MRVAAAGDELGDVSYGGVAAGTRAVQMLKQVVSALRTVPTDAATALLSDLARWTSTTAPLRGQPDEPVLTR